MTNAEPRTTARVFISHCSEDKPFVRRLEVALKTLGAEVWVDHEVRLGDSLPRTISDAISWSAVVILVWSQSAAQSRWVGLEWSAAVQLEKVVIPCLIDEQPLPAILSSVLYLDSKNSDIDIERLRESIFLGGARTAGISTPSSQERTAHTHGESFYVKRVSTATRPRPLVSWLMVTTFSKHRWWKRLGEFLSERFPPQDIEFLILGMQDIDFGDRAFEEGGKIASAYTFLEGAGARWENVTFVNAYQSEFNLYKAINVLTQLARGDILVYRDADCMLLQYGFTQYLVENLLRHRLGVLGVPSLSNGRPFKPRASDITMEDPRYPGLLINSTVNGMAVATLRDIEIAVGGRNEHTPLMQYTHYCAKIAQMGLLMAYAVDRGWWLATAYDAMTGTRTDIERDPSLIEGKQAAFSLMSRFYRVQGADILSRIMRDVYNICLDNVPVRVLETVEHLYPAYERSQSLDPKLKVFDFKPWQCLSHPSTPEYVTGARERASSYYEPVILRARSAGIYSGE